MDTRTPYLVSCAAAFFIGFVFVRFDSSLLSVIIANVVVIIIATPSLVGALQWLGRQRGILFLIVMGIIPLTVEALAILTGIPYGNFSYSENLGPLLFDLFPVTIVFAYLPLLLGAVTIAWHRAGQQVPFRILVSALLLLLIDLVIDPASVHTGIWTYGQPGAYFGVPLSNFLGWMVTGTVYTLLVHILSTIGDHSSSLPPLVMVWSLLVTLSLWSGYLFREMLLFPAVFGILLVLGITFAIFTNHNTSATHRRK